jgi:hypothetical protein
MNDGGVGRAERKIGLKPRVVAIGAEAATLAGSRFGTTAPGA